MYFLSRIFIITSFYKQLCGVFYSNILNVMLTLNSPINKLILCLKVDDIFSVVCFAQIRKLNESMVLNKSGDLLI